MLQITRINQNKNEVETLIKVDTIEGIFEKEKKPIELYNEDGELVETKPRESLYEIVFNNGKRIFVTKETYNKLKEKYLKVETL